MSGRVRDEDMAGILYPEQEPGVLAPATVNPLLLRQVQAQRASNPRPNVTDIFGYGPDLNSYASNLSRNFAGQFEGLGTPQNFMGPFGFGGITAFHGSPHKFDAFDMKKVGTGEGAQAYGHGLYFAENPKVAKEYSKVSPSALPPPRRAFQGRELEPGTPEYHAASLLDGDRTLPSVRKEVQGWLSNARPGEDISGWRRTLEILNQAQNKADFKRLKPAQHLYKVDIPDDQVAKMLDWDAPLSKQPENVRAFIERAMKATPEEIRGASEGFGPFGDLGATALAAIRRGDIKTGADLVNYVGNGPAGTNILRASGIPGIKYLDQGSRSGGKGTSNFVVFDDQIPKILSRE
jgi:hypothetical protein